jgi:single-stranded-DNA-specific exonuclease
MRQGDSFTVEKHWLVPPAISSEADSNLSVYHPVLRQILFNRGYAIEAQARRFLAAEADFDTSPSGLSGMEATVDRVRFAVKHGETIAIYGDYDVDGVTATALLMQMLQALGAKAKPYIPNRFEEGYGLNREALGSLKADGVNLVITVDCGIRSPGEAEYAREIGLELIITDHHHPADENVPPAFAVICPKQPGDTYPEKNLAGVGIAFKIAEALAATEGARYGVQALLDLVALGTVADLAPLIGENRMLVRRGLEEIRRTARQGLFSLANVAEIPISKTTAGQIGFVLGPRLNAAGRLQSALDALELLTTTDSLRAGHLAQQLDVQNRQRQALTRETQEKAEALATAEDADPILLFAADESFNPGVVGLAASRLVDTYYRPAVVASKGPQQTRGSCRSIPEFHITDALDQCADLLVRHGGHAAAAGFTVQNANLDALKRRLTGLASSRLGSQDLRPSLGAEMELKLSELNFELIRRLADLEPTGYGNREAVFVTRGAPVKSSRTVGAEGKHLKLTLEDERGATVDAIGFRMGNLQPTLPRQVDIAYTLEVNEYGGRTTLQLNLKDLRAPGGAR